MILDEAKTMIEIGAYHNHIVNLQGVTYSLNLEEKRFLDVSNDSDNYLDLIARSYRDNVMEFACEYQYFWNYIIVFPSP